MFVVEALPPQIDAAAIERLEGVQTATIGHFLDFGFMTPEIRALLPGRRIAGTAVTCRFAGIDGAILHYALGQVRPGDVLVIDRAGDRRHACVGGGIAFAAQVAGVKGIIVDGMATDIEEIRDHGLPVWACGLSPVTTKRLFTHGEFCVPVQCGGVPVSPGDAILADEDGVIVLKPSQLEAAVERAIQMQEAEPPRRKRIAAGEKLPDINGSNARIREILAAQKARTR